jgi:hypothetical protein
MSDADTKKLVDINAPYANDGKSNGERVAAAQYNQNAPEPTKMVGQGITVLGKGETAEHRKFGNGKDVSDELAYAAPKRDKDLHPSNTYVGEGDEVDESEWD